MHIFNREAHSYGVAVINWDLIVKNARECHTKVTWELFFCQFGDQIATTSHSKPLQDIFRTLKADPQSPLYDASIWGKLMQGCLSSWNLELGVEIAEFVKKIPGATINLPAAQIYLESGQPAQARDMAQRTLRLASLSSAEKLHLEILIANSFAQEGKRAKAIKQLAKVRESMTESVVTSKEKADFLTHMARMNFFLGLYLESSTLFFDASEIYLELKEWEAAAKGIFNTAACHLNGGLKKREEAFAMVEKCRKLAIAHDLPGPLSHCEAAYGLDAFQHGDFPAAREHLRLALEYLPISDKSYRRLHILSMLAYTYLAMGRFHLAKKFGQQTLDLAALDESERNKNRYISLKAELMWEDGQVEESCNLLYKIVESFEQRGVHTLEDLSTLNRYLYQSTLLGQTYLPPRAQFSEPIKNHSTWITFLHSCGMQHLLSQQFNEADKLFFETLSKSRTYSYRSLEAWSLQGLILSRLSRRIVDDAIPIAREYEVAVARLGETPLKTSLNFIDSAIAYQKGDFEECVRILRGAQKASRLSYTDDLVLQAWIATIEGRSIRLTNAWQMQLVTFHTKFYFSPFLEALDEKNFKVSGNYIVSLEKHPSLATLLHFLLLKPNYVAETADIQTNVWRQSIHSQGWQQKIRNTIMRLRDFFPYTIAPLILHADRVYLNKDAIELLSPKVPTQDSEEEVLRLVSECPMSSHQIANRLAVSPATAKRLLKKLTDNHHLTMHKKGRNVFYTSRDLSSAP